MITLESHGESFRCYPVRARLVPGKVLRTGASATRIFPHGCIRASSILCCVYLNSDHFASTQKTTDIRALCWHWKRSLTTNGRKGRSISITIYFLISAAPSLMQETFIIHNSSLHSCLPLCLFLLRNAGC